MPVASAAARQDGEQSRRSRRVRLSREQERELSQRIRRGDEAARNELVEAHLGFVASVAMRYRGYGLSVDELISAGRIGLLAAAERFEGTRDARFISYAKWWIRGAMLKELSECRLQRSLDEPLSSDEEDSGTLLDILPAESAPASDEAAEASSARSRLAESLAQLDEQERAVLLRHFGLGGHEPLTLAQIAGELGLRLSLVRRIREDALNKLVAGTDHVATLEALAGMYGSSFDNRELQKVRERRDRVRRIRERRRQAIIGAVAEIYQRRHQRPFQPG